MTQNIAFIDGQNLHLGVTGEGWKVHHKKFRQYLTDKYKVDEAYYFIGYLTEENNDLYKALQKAGFIVIFKEHKENFKGKKKGNVDSDIVFEAMKSLIEEDFEKILIVSGDGDYKKLVDYLIKKEKFQKMLFPNAENASSLYKKLGSEYYDYLKSVQQKIEYISK